jgi:PhnB protein
MKIKPHLTFKGQCEEAFKFYEKCLHGEIRFSMTYGESPTAKDLSPDMHKKIIHISLVVGDQELTGCDAPADRFQKPQGFSVLLDLQKPEEVDRIFLAMSEKGTVQMPIAETFWAKRFGMVVDRFGTPWLLNCAKPV